MPLQFPNLTPTIGGFGVRREYGTSVRRSRARTRNTRATGQSGPRVHNQPDRRWLEPSMDGNSLKPNNRNRETIVAIAAANTSDFSKDIAYSLVLQSQIEGR